MELKRTNFCAWVMGMFVAFKGEAWIGRFNTANDAYAASLAKRGNVPFLAKEVLEKDRVETTY